MYGCLHRWAISRFEITATWRPAPPLACPGPRWRSNLGTEPQHVMSFPPCPLPRAVGICNRRETQLPRSSSTAGQKLDDVCAMEGNAHCSAVLRQDSQQKHDNLFADRGNRSDCPASAHLCSLEGNAKRLSHATRSAGWQTAATHARTIGPARRGPLHKVLRNTPNQANLTAEAD